jgi:hypothetical protein
VDVQPADVIAPDVTVNVAGPEVPVTVEPQVSAPDVHVDVQPAELQVIPAEPKDRTIKRDAMGNIVGVHEEP